MPRRYYTYDAGRGWDLWNLISSIGVIFQIGASCSSFYNLIYSYFFKGRRLATIRGMHGRSNGRPPRPPPEYNFEHLPSCAAVVRSGISSIPRIPTGNTNNRSLSPTNGLHQPPVRHRGGNSVAPALAPQGGHDLPHHHESALFSIFRGGVRLLSRQEPQRPYPSELFHMPIPATVAAAWKQLHDHGRGMVSSSGTAASASISGGSSRSRSARISSASPPYEWHELIFKEHFTISTNIAGATFYSLVGLHASHVVIGSSCSPPSSVSSLRGKIDHAHHEHVEMISWYWQTSSIGCG